MFLGDSSCSDVPVSQCREWVGEDETRMCRCLWTPPLGPIPPLTVQWEPAASAIRRACGQKHHQYVSVRPTCSQTPVVHRHSAAAPQRSQTVELWTVNIPVTDEIIQKCCKPDKKALLQLTSSIKNSFSIWFNARFQLICYLCSDKRDGPLHNGHVQ